MKRQKTRTIYCFRNRFHAFLLHNLDFYIDSPVTIKLCTKVHLLKKLNGIEELGGNIHEEEHLSQMDL